MIDVAATKQYEALQQALAMHKLQLTKAVRSAVLFSIIVALLWMVISYITHVSLQQETLTFWFGQFKWTNFLFTISFLGLLRYLIKTQKIYKELSEQQKAAHQLLLQHPQLAKF